MERLFGDSIDRLTCSHIRSLTEIKYPESQYVEFKAFKKDQDYKKLEEHVRDTILRSIVGFLNSEAGEGILILGIEGKHYAEKITPIPYEALSINPDSKNKRDVVYIKLSGWILNHIKCVPQAPPGSSLNYMVKVFDARQDCGLNENGFIALIHVKRTFEAVYYDDIYYEATIRENDRTRRLTPVEIVQLVERRSQPIPLLILVPIEVDIEQRTITFDRRIVNVGSKPTNVSAIRLHLYSKALLGKIKYRHDNACVITLKSVGSASRVIYLENDSIRIEYWEYSYLFPKVPLAEEKLTFNLNIDNMVFGYIQIIYGGIINTKYNMVRQECCSINIDIYRKVYDIYVEYSVHSYTTGNIIAEGRFQRTFPFGRFMI